jgi:hypothetical protein
MNNDFDRYPYEPHDLFNDIGHNILYKSVVNDIYYILMLSKNNCAMPIKIDNKKLIKKILRRLL